ncbi:unnamed protein product [Urochloa humidicola]
MGMEPADPHSKKRRTEPPHVRQEAGGSSTVSSPHEMHLPSPALVGTNASPHLVGPTGESESSEESHGQEPLPVAARGEEEDGGSVDYISRLPDAILGEIVSLLPTKAGVRTQILASRWRNLWLSAPLNLDLSNAGVYGEALSSLISRILGMHPGPVRRFSIPLRDLSYRPMTIDAWLRSPALDNLQELDLEIQSYGHRCPLRHFMISYSNAPFGSCGCFKQTEEWLLPASAFRFSSTLHVATISNCHIVEGMVGTLCFPLLTQLALEHVMISGDSLHSTIATCPVLECLLLKNIECGYRTSLRINSPSLISFGFDSCSREIIIEDAPSLKRLLQLSKRMIKHVSVISAPNLEIVGSIYELDYSKLTFGDTVIQVW